MIDQMQSAIKQRVDGISDDQAMQAARAATDFIKDKLPAPLAARLEELVDGDGEGDLDVGSLGNAVKGFLGR